MICPKSQEERENCNYLIPGGAGECKANICQKSLDQINDTLTKLLDKFDHILKAEEPDPGMFVPEQPFDYKHTERGLEITKKKQKDQPLDFFTPAPEDHQKYSTEHLINTTISKEPKKRGRPRSK